MKSPRDNMDGTELLPCPFDSNPAEYEHYGTCAKLQCTECACGPDIQISDLMTIEERQAMTFDINAKNYGYPNDVIERVKAELFSRWNTRTPDIEKLYAALDDFAKYARVHKEYSGCLPKDVSDSAVILLNRHADIIAQARAGREGR